ncbi:MAG: hypothetical protein ACRCRR_01675 [Rickettsia sp.]
MSIYFIISCKNSGSNCNDSKTSSTSSNIFSSFIYIALSGLIASHTIK